MRITKYYQLVILLLFTNNLMAQAPTPGGYQSNYELGTHQEGYQATQEIWFTEAFTYSCWNITSSSTNINISPTSYCAGPNDYKKVDFTITFPSNVGSFTYVITLTNTNDTWPATFSFTFTGTVEASPPPETNTITGNQTILVGSTPEQLYGTDMSGTILWEQKVGDGNWEDAVGLTDNNLKDFSPGALEQTGDYRYRRLVDGGTSNEVLITVTALTNTISGDQSIYVGTTPSKLTGTDMSGVILWQQKTSTSNWINAEGLTANNLKDFSPGVLNETTTYRRLLDGNPSVNNVVVTVNQITNTISGNQTIPRNSKPNVIRGNNVSLSCLWQQKVNGGIWEDAVGVGKTENNSNDFYPGVLYETTYYRRIVLEENISNVIKITVESTDVCGSGSAHNCITGNQTIIRGNEATQFSGNVSIGPYQWQISTNGINWSNISGANMPFLSPGYLSETSLFRRIDHDSYSNILRVSVVNKEEYCNEGEHLLYDDYSDWKKRRGTPRFLSDFSTFGVELILPFYDAVESEAYLDYQLSKGVDYTITLYAKILPSYNGKVYVRTSNGKKSEIVGSSDFLDDNWRKIEFNYQPTDNKDYFFIGSESSDFFSEIHVAYVSIVTEQIALNATTSNYHNGRLLKARNITSNSDVTLPDQFQLELIADESIQIFDGFHAEPGSYFSAKVIDIYSDCVANSNVTVKSAIAKPSEDEFENDTVPEIEIAKTGKEIIENTELKNEEYTSFNSCSNIRVFPNPNDGIFTVRIPDEFDCKRLAIANASGKIIYLNDIENQKNLEMDIRNMPPGIYFIKLISPDKVISRKIIKE